MRSEAPPLLPILRSRAQGEILGLLLDGSNREWTVSELAAATDTALTTAQSEIARLASGDLVSTRKVGRTRLVRANTNNPVVEPLAQVVLMTFGPRVVVAEEFSHVDADHVIIFGSWAARIHGEVGPAPHDVDVLVVGDNLARADVYAAAERAEQRLRKPVNPVLRSVHAWETPGVDPLADEIRRRPSVDLANVIATRGRG